MLRQGLLALFISAAIFAVSSSAYISTEPPFKNDVQNDVPQDAPYNVEDNTQDVIDPNTVVDGIVLADLTPEELEIFLAEKDNLVISELDIGIIKNLVDDRKARAVAEAKKAGVGARKKRWVPIAIVAARALFGAASRGRLTTSGLRLTRQYNRNGNFNDAVRDFNRFNPRGAKDIGGKFNGRTGTVGNHRITVRDGSSSGRPTLEIRSPRAGGGTSVRKFRYNQK